MNYEIRLDEDGELDEVVASGTMTFHLERMDDEEWWIGLTFADGKTLHVDISGNLRVEER